MQKIRLMLLVAAWIALVFVGFVTLESYGYTPGVQAAAAPSWPMGSSLERGLNRCQLVMFVHPKCPCSSASLAELERIAAQVEHDVAITVVFFEPENAPADWRDSANVVHAKRVPGAVQQFDTGGTEQALFHAKISGEVFAYSPTGVLIYHGGVTASRGHEGDNPAKSQLMARLNDPTLEPIELAAFGCTL